MTSAGLHAEHADRARREHLVPGLVLRGGVRLAAGRKAKVPVCSTVPVVKPSSGRPSLTSTWLALPGQLSFRQSELRLDIVELLRGRRLRTDQFSLSWAARSYRESWMIVPAGAAGEWRLRWRWRRPPRKAAHKEHGRRRPPPVAEREKPFHKNTGSFLVRIPATIDLPQTMSVKAVVTHHNW